MVIVSSVMSLLRRAVGKMGVDHSTVHPDVDVPQETLSRKLVRDPVCGMHMAETIAIPLRNGGDLIHFCSTECRDKYLSGSQKLAANA